ncbi:MAG: hypothetical protein MUO50_12015, partial [Longimicrobiales bacterium]|nr:hypothetical protein [Longimicrobiales bacterium]
MWRNMFRLGLLFSLLLLLAPQPADSQVLNRLKKRAAQAAEDQLSQEIEEMIRGAVRCVFDDLACVERARADGQKVVLTDAEGEIMMNDEGQPYMDPSELPPEMAPTPPPASNYDFEPGDRVIFETSFAGDDFGDFPRVLEFLQGNMQVVDWQGQAFLQADQKESRFAIQLPETLPERFTIEFDLYDPTDGEGVSLALTEPPNLGWAWAHYYEGYQFLNAGRSQGSGVWQGGEGTPRVSTTVDSQ